MRSILVLKAYHFDRDDVALPGFHKFMLKQSDEGRGHAQKVRTRLQALLRRLLFILVLICLFRLKF